MKNLAGDGETAVLYAEWYKNENSLEPTSGAITVTLKAGQTVVLQDLPSGTTYAVSEIRIPSGWTMTGSEGLVGTIMPNVAAQGSVTNRYAAVGTGTITAHKRLDGDTLSSGRFSFELLEDGVVIATATNGTLDESEEIAGADGEPVANPWYGTAPVNFDGLRYTEEGVHHYVIREVRGSEDAIDYDTHEESVTVTVTDRGDGRLNAVASYDADGALFVNTLETGTLTLSKSVVNATQAALERAAFRFTVTLSDASGSALTERYAVTGADESEMAHAMFARLREADALGADVLFSEAVPTDGIGLAVMNRLGRAAAFHIVEV